MFRRCAVNRWTRVRPSISISTHRKWPQRPITAGERFKSSTGSSIPPKARPWRQLISLAIVSIPGAFIAYYFLDQDSPSDESFGRYKLVSKEPVSSSAAIFQLEPQNSVQESGRYKDIWRQGIWNVQFKQPQLQILRAYTPLPPVPSSDKTDGTHAADTLRFLIRNDPYGEVSGYLHRLPVESTIEVRGPSLEHAVRQDVKEVVFLAGGTGIAPALQVAHAMFNGGGAAEVQRKRLHILWANRKQEDCQGSETQSGRSDILARSSFWMTWSPWTSQSEREQANAIPQPAEAAVQEQSKPSNAVVRHLSALQARYPGQITVSYFIDEENALIDAQVISKALSWFSMAMESNHGRREIIISGPPGFIGYLAGPKVWQNGTEEQGPLRGLVGAQLAKRNELRNVTVWKV